MARRTGNRKLNSNLTERLNHELGSIPADQIEARVDALNELELTIDGQVYRNIHLVRCFPLSHEEKYISVLDDNEHEIGIIEDISVCQPQVRRLFLDILNTSYLVPHITKVNNINMHGYVPVWNVETDRGPRVLELQSRRETFMIDNRVVIRDADGNRYEIPDVTRLDQRSRRLVEREV